jgi:hypothetical protein
LDSAFISLDSLPDLVRQNIASLSLTLNPFLNHGFSTRSLRDIYSHLTDLFISSLPLLCPSGYRVKRGIAVKVIAAEIILSSIILFNAPPHSLLFKQSYDLPIISSQLDYLSPPPILSSQSIKEEVPFSNPTVASFSELLLKYTTIRSIPTKKYAVTKRILSHWALGVDPEAYDYLTQARADQEAIAMETMSVEEREKIKRRTERRAQAQVRESQRFTQMSQRVAEIEEGTAVAKSGLTFGQLPVVPEGQGLLSQALLGSQAHRGKDGQPPKKKKRTKGF